MKKLNLTNSEINQLKEIIFSKIDEENGIDNINKNLKSILIKIIK